jgi:hypothetical protein
MAWIIYKHTSPSGKIYVGQTKQTLAKRFVNGKGYAHCPKFNAAIKKYGWEAFQTEIIEEGILTQQEANERETYWIAFYNSYYEGYNCTKGGSNSDYACRPVYQINIDTLEIVKTYESVTQAAETLDCPYSTIGCACHQRVIQSQGYYWCFVDEYDAWRPRMSQKTFNVICIETQQIYLSASDAQTKTNIEAPYITACCRKEQKTAGGYHWARLSDIELQDEYSEFINQDPTISKFRPVICIETQETYDYAAEASRILNINKESISRCLRNEREYAGGYHWAYVDDPAQQEKWEKFINIPRKDSRVVCFEAKTEYQSCAEVIKNIPNTSGIYQVLNNPYKTAGGYHWCSVYLFENNWQPLDLPPINAKAVYCAELDKEYVSIKLAAQDTGASEQWIGKVCKRPFEGLMAGKMHWCFLEDKEVLLSLKVWKDKIQCIDTLKLYDTIAEAAQDTNSRASSISRCLSGHLKTTNKLRWQRIQVYEPYIVK